MPLYLLIEAHVLAAERLHGDDTTVPVLAKTKTDTGRIWTYVRDDRPFGGPAPPAAIFHYSRDRRGEYPVGHLRGWRGILQADAYRSEEHTSELPSLMRIYYAVFCSTNQHSRETAKKIQQTYTSRHT